MRDLRVLVATGVATADCRPELLVEQDSPDAITNRLNRLNGSHYVEEHVAKTGEMLVSELPFALRLDTRSLLGP